MDTSVSTAFANLLLVGGGVALSLLGFVLLNAGRSKWALACLLLAVGVIVVSLITG